MDLVSACALRVGSIAWQPRPGAFMLTVVCKATFELLPGLCRWAPEQDPPNESDDHWNDDERRSLHAASDLVPFKRRADVFLVGHAYAPRAKPASSLVARLMVGELDKAIEVHADRAWTQYGELRDGPPFFKMPLRYERAAGGPGTSNPVGVAAEAQPDRVGRRPLPNLQPRGVHLTHPGDAIPPIGFGPIAPRWPERAAKLHRHAAAWDHRRWNARPLPEDVDAAFFNTAPSDQQVTEIRGNERIVLECLHPEHPKLITNLPGVSPRATIFRVGVGAQELRLRCDTLAFDTDRGVCNLVWRAQVALARLDEAGRITVTLDGVEGDAGATIVGGVRVGAALPFAGTTPDEDAGEEASTTIPLVMSAPPAALPFQGNSSPWAQPSIAQPTASPPQRSEDDRTGTIFGAMKVGEALPFAAPSGVARPEIQALAPTPTLGSASPITPIEPLPPRFAPPPIEQPPRLMDALVLPASPRAEPAAPPPPLVTDEPEPAREELAVDDGAAANEGPPDVELTIAQVAVIAAEIAEKQAPRADVLAKHGVSEKAWSANERRWDEAVEDELAEGSSRLRSASDRAYVEAVEGFRGPITVAEYAQILIGLERGRANQVLDRLGIQRPALMRIVRVWTKKVAGDARLAEEARGVFASTRE